MLRMTLCLPLTHFKSRYCFTLRKVNVLRVAELGSALLGHRENNPVDINCIEAHTIAPTP